MSGGLQRLERWSLHFNRATLYLAVIGGVCLLAIVLIVMVGVVMRYAFGTPLLGINEFVELAAVALVMSSLPFCTAQQDHVAVDMFEAALGRWGRFAGDIVTRLLSGFVLAILAQRAVLKSLDAMQWGDATNMLRMPIWPFYMILAVGAGLCVLLFALQLALILLRGPK
jgi:TRAP-type transport system small permease protein